MSIENSIEKIKREIGIKKCLIVEGNVGDIYLNKNKRIHNNLKDYLIEIFEELEYDSIIYWDRVDGAIGDLESLKLVDDKEVKGDKYLDEEEEEELKPEKKNGLFKQPSEMFNIVLKNLTNSRKKIIFILNWSQYIFDGGGQNIVGENLENITVLAKAIRDGKVDWMAEELNQSSVVIITNKLSMFPLSFYQSNPEVSCINLSKPDRLERKIMLEKIENSFNVKSNYSGDLMSNEKSSEYVDMLDDFTNREIIQMAKLSRKEKGKLNFEKLFYLFKYGEKENPWEKLDYRRVKNIEKELAKKVVGQDQAIQKIKQTIIKAYMGLTGIHKTSSRSMPKGVFFFVGPTGVGKTELSKALAKFLFGDEQACIRFDMSEYATENSDQKLIGAPPGYVGYEEGGQLTNAIKQKPFSVILFDEIEKAAKPNPRILDIFLQILEDGRLTDSKGDTVYFNDTIIIFTSNLGASQVLPSNDYDSVSKEFINIVKNYFDNEIKRPEILGRMGYSNIVPFNFIIDKEFIKQIALSKLQPIAKGIKEKYKLDIRYDDQIKIMDYIIRHVDINKGGRDVLNAINDHLLDPLANFLFDNKEYLNGYRGGCIVVKLNDQILDFDWDFDNP